MGARVVRVFNNDLSSRSKLVAVDNRQCRVGQLHRLRTRIVEVGAGIKATKGTPTVSAASGHTITRATIDFTG
jgi:ribosomal protein L10